MNKKEASALADTIALSLGDKAAKVHQIGNGTHVVIIHHQFWCWQASDWSKYRTTVPEDTKQQKTEKLDSWKTNWAEDAAEAIV
jgi:hypothetical protein